MKIRIAVAYPLGGKFKQVSPDGRGTCTHYDVLTIEDGMTIADLDWQLRQLIAAYPGPRTGNSGCALATLHIDQTDWAEEQKRMARQAGIIIPDANKVPGAEKSSSKESNTGGLNA